MTAQIEVVKTKTAFNLFDPDIYPVIARHKYSNYIVILNGIGEGTIIDSGQSGHAIGSYLNSANPDDFEIYNEPIRLSNVED